MHFEYGITVDEFVASQLLYFKLSLGWKRGECAVRWIIAGLLFIAVGGIERSPTWAPFLVASVGAWCLYYGRAAVIAAGSAISAYSGPPAKRLRTPLPPRLRR